MDRATLLDDVIHDCPFPYKDDRAQIGPMVVVACPVTGSQDVLSRAAAPNDPSFFLQCDLAEHARGSDPYPGQGSTGLGGVPATHRRGADVWVLSDEHDLSGPFQARLEVNARGQSIYWHSPTINGMARRGEGAFLLMEQSVTRAVHQHLAAAKLLYDRGGYVGAVDVAVAVLDIENARAASLAQGFEPGPIYGAPDYRANARRTMTELADTRSVVRGLLAPLYDAISVREYDPYAASPVTTTA